MLCFFSQEKVPCLTVKNNCSNMHIDTPSTSTNNFSYSIKLPAVSDAECCSPYWDFLGLSWNKWNAIFITHGSSHLKNVAQECQQCCEQPPFCNTLTLEWYGYSPTYTASPAQTPATDAPLLLGRHNCGWLYRSLLQACRLDCLGVPTLIAWTCPVKNKQKGALFVNVPN